MGRKGINHIWTDEKISQLKNICATAYSWQEVGIKMKENSDLCAVIATRENILRPHISKNYGGRRPGCGRPRKYV